MAASRPRFVSTNIGSFRPNGDLKCDINSDSFGNISLTQAIDLESHMMYQSCAVPSKYQSMPLKASQQGYSQSKAALKDSRPIVPAAPRPRSQFNKTNGSLFNNGPMQLESGDGSFFTNPTINRPDHFVDALPAQKSLQHQFRQIRQNDCDAYENSEDRLSTEVNLSQMSNERQALKSKHHTALRNFGSRIDNFCLSDEVQSSHPPSQRKDNIHSNRKTLFRATSTSLREEQDNPTVSGVLLRSVDEIPRQFQHIFKFPYFNILQSLLLEEVLYTDKSIVASAPTGSGKTVIFELALIRLLTKPEFPEIKRKIVYMAPMKALCSERYLDWNKKFENLGIKCLEITGDSELDDFTELFNANLICTTPEKWDSMSRRWKDNKILFQQIQLFLIDEIHILNDPHRGATVEAVVSRMKTLETAQELDNSSHIRFVAVSATMPNYKDIAEWLGTPSKPASAFNLGEEFRPVKLEKIVLGYPFKAGTSDFRFDMNLSYRLKSIIETHSQGKPSLVFCSTRKSVVQSAEALAGDLRSNSLLTNFSVETLHAAAKSVHEHKLSELLHRGIGYHHAGLDIQDRHTVEELFKASQLPVLISTSTLAMGVNLPAHLVVIKSTHFYNMGMVQEYSNMQVLQMIGRAGRPQFDTSATAVIMTKAELKAKYTTLVNGTQLIESSLHRNLIEHLNAEIVLQTISDMNLVVEWIRHTFLYVRVLKNPCFYGLSSNLSTQEVEKKLQDLCLQNVTHLTSENLVSVNDGLGTIWPTENGKLMARYCIAFETMKHFGCIDKSQENISEMIKTIAHCAEFDDVLLRINEKKILNSLNRDKNHETIRFPLQGKIKTKQMKVNCLIQAQLSCLPVHDFSLSQDMAKIFRVGQRVAKCLMEYMYQGNSYSVLLHAILLYKAFKAKLWFDSRYVARQLDGIGPTMSLALANAGLSSFHKLDEAHPRDIEVIVNRHPPFGNQVKESLTKLPRYELSVEQMKCYKPHKCVLVLSVDLLNRSAFETVPSSQITFQSILFIGDADNNIVFKWRVFDATIIRDGMLTRNVEINRAAEGTKLSISLLNIDTVGLDIQTEYEPVYQEGWFPTCKKLSASKDKTPASKLKMAMDKAKTESNASPGLTKSSCNHKCLNKSTCGHKCCKSDEVRKRPAKLMSASSQSESSSKSAKVERPGYIESKEMKDILGIFSVQQTGPRLKMSKHQSSSGNSLTNTKFVNQDKQSWDNFDNQGDANVDEFDNDDLSEVIVLDDDDMLEDVELSECAIEESGQAQSDGIWNESLETYKHDFVSKSKTHSAEMQALQNPPPSKILQKSEKFPPSNVQVQKRTFQKDLTMIEKSGGRTNLFDSMKKQDHISSFVVAHTKTYSKQDLCERDMWEQENNLLQRQQSKSEDKEEHQASSSCHHAVSDWADLDMFHQSRQSLFKNGRPIHLIDEDFEEDLPSLTNTPDMSSPQQKQNHQLEIQKDPLTSEADAACQWTTTTSSDEELCHLTDGVTCPLSGSIYSQPNKESSIEILDYDHLSCHHSPNYVEETSQLKCTPKPTIKTPALEGQIKNLPCGGLNQTPDSHQEGHKAFNGDDCIPGIKYNTQYSGEPGLKNFPSYCQGKNSSKHSNVSTLPNKLQENSTDDILAPTVVSLTDSGQSNCLTLSVQDNDDSDIPLKHTDSAEMLKTNPTTPNNSQITQSGQNYNQYKNNFCKGLSSSLNQNNHQNKMSKSPYQSHRYGHVLAWNKTVTSQGLQPCMKDQACEERKEKNLELNFFSGGVRTQRENTSGFSTGLFDGIF